MEIIDKDKVVAKIEKRIKETESMQPKFDQFWAGQISAFKGVLKILDTLETKEVDLEKEVRKFIKDNCTSLEEPDEFLTTLMQLDDMVIFAKHFYILGLNAKGE